jgi:hypothetical protein
VIAYTLSLLAIGYLLGAATVAILTVVGKVIVKTEEQSNEHDDT